MNEIKIELRTVNITKKLISQIRKVNYSKLCEEIGEVTLIPDVKMAPFEKAIGWIHPTVLNKTDKSSTGWMLFQHPETKEYMLFNAMKSTIEKAKVPQIFVLK